MKHPNDPELLSMYRQAAEQAHTDGIRACEEKRLTTWIWYNCKFPLECLFYLVLGIGCELADYEAQLCGFEPAARTTAGNDELNQKPQEYEP